MGKKLIKTEIVKGRLKMMDWLSEKCILSLSNYTEYYFTHKPNWHERIMGFDLTKKNIQALIALNKGDKQKFIVNQALTIKGKLIQALNKEDAVTYTDFLEIGQEIIISAVPQKNLNTRVYKIEYFK